METNEITETPPNQELVTTKLQNNIAIITLNRPEKRNAINDQMRADLCKALEWAERSPSVRALIITGAGKSFCSGGDISSMNERLAAPMGEVGINGWKRQRQTHKLVTRIHNIPKPTIAAVNGTATGLGCDIALCCDFIIGSSNAKFAMSYILRGLIPDGGGMYFLPRRVGLAKAKELIFSGCVLTAEQALEINMIEKKCDSEVLLAEAHSLAARMTVGSPEALALAKSIMETSLESTMDEIFAKGSQAQAICYTTDFHRQSVKNFLNERT